MTAATRTAAYSETHRAILLTARERNLRPYEVRLLLALHERGGTGRTDQLEEDLCEDQGTAIRRASIRLRSRRFISGAAADGSGQVKRGIRMSLVLTQRGQGVAERVLGLVEPARAMEYEYVGELPARAGVTCYVEGCDAGPIAKIERAADVKPAGGAGGVHGVQFGDGAMWGCPEGHVYFVRDVALDG